MRASNSAIAASRSHSSDTPTAPERSARARPNTRCAGICLIVSENCQYSLCSLATASFTPGFRPLRTRAVSQIMYRSPLRMSGASATTSAKISFNPSRISSAVPIPLSGSAKSCTSDSSDAPSGNTGSASQIASAKLPKPLSRNGAEILRRLGRKGA